MSETLERIEMMASCDAIKEMGEIHRILRSLLNIPYDEFGYEKGYYDFLSDDISSGFLLDERKVKKCTVGEILIIMTCMPGNPWFKIDEHEIWYRFSNLGRDFYSASACFYLTEILIGAERINPVVKQFMNTGYSAFIDYLDAMRSSENKSELPEVPEDHKLSPELDKLRSDTIEYVRNNNKNRPEMQINDITIGNILRTVHRRGNRPWMLGNEFLDDYADRMMITYATAHDLFMKSIRKCLIDVGTQNIIKTLDKCSEFNKYDHFNQIDLKCCIEERR